MNVNTDDLVVIPPKVSDETMREIAKFFMKTSVPRILAKRQKGIKNERLLPNLDRKEKEAI